jgi:hypothetical protein
VTAPAISSWENGSKIPPSSRIEAYSRLFATRRSLDSGTLRLLAADELTAEERRQEAALLEELTALRLIETEESESADAEPTGSGFWYFADGRPVTIVCGVLPPEEASRMPYTDFNDPDYVAAYNYTDVDALIELFGHIRAVNAVSHPVRFRQAVQLRSDDYTTHLVLLGGVDVNRATRDVHERLDLPVRQLDREGEGAVGGFEVETDDGTRTFSPHLVTTKRGKVLLEDVGHFFRAPNPFNVKRTVTICNGQYGRGTYGAVRALTDERFRDRNEEYVADRFGTDAGYSILMRVQIVNGEVLTPDWTRPETRLHEWPEVSVDKAHLRGPSTAP